MIAHRQTSHPLLPKNQTRISVQWLVHVWSKPYLLPSSPDYPRPRPTLSSQSLVHCIDAARSVIHIASQSHALIPPSHHLALYCQYLWSSAVILLLCEIQARDEIIEAVDWQAEACRRCLQTLEPVWPGSKKLKELLNDVASRAKEAMVPKPSGKKRKSSAYKDKDKERPIPHPSQGHQSRCQPTHLSRSTLRINGNLSLSLHQRKDKAYSKFLTPTHLQMWMSRLKVPKRIIQCIL